MHFHLIVYLHFPPPSVSVSFLIFSILLVPLLVYFSLLSCQALQLVSPLVALSPHIFTFLLLSSLSSTPSLPSGCKPLPLSPLLPTLRHPTWLYFLSAPLVTRCHLFLSQDHDVLKATAPPFILSQNLCEVPHRCCSPYYQLSRPPSPHVAAQSLEIWLLKFLYFIHLLFSRLNLFHLTVSLQDPQPSSVSIRFPLFFPLHQFSSLRFLLCGCRSHRPLIYGKGDAVRRPPTEETVFQPKEKLGAEKHWPGSPAPTRGEGTGWQGGEARGAEGAA